MQAELFLATFEYISGQIIDFALFAGVTMLMNSLYTEVEYVHRIPLIMPLELVLLLVLPITMLMIL